MTNVMRFHAPGPWITRDLKECVLASDYDALAARLRAEEEAHAALQARCYEGFPSVSDGIFDAWREDRARLAKVTRLLHELGWTNHAIEREIATSDAIEQVTADSAPAAPWTSGLLGYPCPACGITLTADHDCTAGTVSAGQEER